MKNNLLWMLTAAVIAMNITSCERRPADYDEETIQLAPANCFVVTAPGAYAFKALKGNSTLGVGEVATVEVLWESFGTMEKPARESIVKEVSYTYYDSMIRFTTQPTLQNGNALIAAKDESGNILWSWHVWVCKGWNPDKTAHSYANGAGTMMDRNLGATSAVPGDVAALGLLYQWGRKDPFLASGKISENSEAASTLDWPEPVLSDTHTGTIAYSVAHPTTYIASVEDNYDWYYTGSYSTENSRWQEEKTMYDPCPAGWKVPYGPTAEHNGFWGTASGKTFVIINPDKELCGYDFNGIFSSSGLIWYPFAGFRDDVAGKLSATGSNAGSWTSAADLDEIDPNAKVMAFGLDCSYTSQGDMMVFMNNDYFRAVAHSVRCIKDTPTNN